MVHGAADISMRDYDPRRFGRYADNSESESTIKSPRRKKTTYFAMKSPSRTSTVWMVAPLSRVPCLTA